MTDVADRLRLDGYPFTTFRVEVDSPASDQNSIEVCYAGIDRSAICVCILGARYGYIHPETGISISEMEFKYAIDRERPVLAFVLDCEMEARQRNFRQTVKDIVSGKFRKSASSVGDLKYELR